MTLTDLELIAAFSYCDNYENRCADCKYVDKFLPLFCRDELKRMMKEYKERIKRQEDDLK